MAGFFSTDSLVREEHRKGDIPSSRTAYGLFLKLAIPSVAEMVLVSLVSTVDTMMVSTLGTAAISSVGLTIQPRMIALCVFFGLNVGITAIISRRKGEGRQADAQKTLRSMLLIALGLSILLGGLCYVFSHPLMRLAGAKDDTVEMASVYFRILMLGLPANAVTMSICAATRGIGKTRITMVINGIANIVNVIFNYFLINGHCGFPALGIRGAAIASVIGMVVGMVIALVSVARRKSYFSLRYVGEDFKLKKDVVGPVLSVSGNALLEQLCLRIGFLVFARLVAELGTSAYAAHQICIQCLNLTFYVADGLATAGTSLVGQNLGAKRPDLSMMYGKIAQRVALVAAVFIASLVALLRYPIVGLFSHDPEVVPLAITVMVIVAVFQPLQMSAVSITGCLRGAGDTKYVARMMMLCVTIIRPILCAAAIYVFHLGLAGAWFAMIGDMIVRFIMCYTRFSGNKWADIRL